MSCIAVSSWGRTKAPPPKKLLSSVLNLHRASDRKCSDACRGSEAGVFDCQGARVLDDDDGTGGGASRRKSPWHHLQRSPRSCRCNPETINAGHRKVAAVHDAYGTVAANKQNSRYCLPQRRRCSTVPR